VVLSPGANKPGEERNQGIGRREGGVSGELKKKKEKGGAQNAGRKGRGKKVR